MEKYPSSFCLETKYDKEIEEKMLWFWIGNPYWYEIIQRAPSEISCKYFVLGFLHSKEVSIDDIAKEQNRLISDNNVTLEDLEWLCGQSHPMQKRYWRQRIDAYKNASNNVK